MAQRSTTEAATKKLVEQMLASFAAVLDSEFRHKLEAIELRLGSNADDKIRRLDVLIGDIHQSIYEIEERLTDNVYPCIKEIQADLSKAKKRKHKKKP